MTPITDDQIAALVDAADRAEVRASDIIAPPWELRAIRALASRVQADAAVIAGLRETLEWYGENARLCRLIHSEGDKGRNALNDDGGKRAQAALSPPPVLGGAE